MMDKEVLRSEAAQYRLLASQLLEQFGAVDDETLKDTLQGLSDLPEMISEIVRSGLDDEALLAGLKQRLEDMQARMGRLKARQERKRELVAWAMGLAAIPRLEAADFTVYLRQGSAKLMVSDESKVPERYLLPQPPKIDRTLLLKALKNGDIVDGASLVPGSPHIAVKTT